MRLLRHKWFVALFFCLITSGQAYPYSYAWAMGQHEECGCNLSGRKCIHGCDLKKKRQGGHDHAAGAADQHSGHSEHSGHAHHAMTGPAPIDHAGHGEAHGQSIHEHAGNEETPVWVNPDCSRQQRRQVLSFRSEPFLPQQSLAVFQPLSFGFELGDSLALVGVPAGLDPPPPKA